MSSPKWQPHISSKEYVCADCKRPNKQGVVMYWRKEIVCRECFVRIIYRRSKAYTGGHWRAVSKPTVVVS
jgi:DNA-directed RNA polymerase subunit RPC12/RpoP